MIGVCEETIKQFDCSCYDCKVLKNFAEEIAGVRIQNDYKSIVAWTLANIRSGECFELLVNEIFCKEKQSANFGRAFTLLVFTYDVCSSIQDDDIKQKVLNIVHRHLSTQNVDWALLTHKQFTPTRGDTLKTLSLACCTVILNIYTYYLLM